MLDSTVPLLKADSRGLVLFSGCEKTRHVTPYRMGVPEPQGCISDPCTTIGLTT